MTRTLLLASAVAMPLALAATPTLAESENLVDTAAAAGSFQTLIKAVETAGLSETLKGEGPFTIFAPTDDAFAQLPEGTLDQLLQPENQDQLVEILTYHVVPQKVMAKDIAGKMAKLTTLEGGEIEINSAGRINKVEQAAIKQPDVTASNGVIHVIDQVLIPEQL